MADVSRYLLAKTTEEEQTITNEVAGSEFLSSMTIEVCSLTEF